MNTKRLPYDTTGHLKHEIQDHAIPEVTEVALDGLRVYFGVDAQGDTLVAYPSFHSAEEAAGNPKLVQSALLWELIKANPAKEILIKVQ